MNIFKKFLFLPILLLILSGIPTSVSYANSEVLWDSYEVPSTRQKERLLDNADLLSDTEEADILAKLDSASAECESNIVILTVNSHTGSIQDYADDYFDYNGFGADYNGSGILFMLSMDTREWAIGTSGTAIDAFTDYGQENLMDQMLPYLSNGDYNDAFITYINVCKSFFKEYANGTPVDYGNESNYKSTSEILGYIPISLIIGLIIALIPIIAMRSQLETVHMKNNAAGYQSHEGLNMRIHQDRFIRSHVTHRPIPQDNGSSSGRSGSHHGGSTIHTSSSGHSHGGSHGHF